MKNILLAGSNGFIGGYFKDNYSTEYNIKTFSFLDNNLKDLDLSNTDTILHLSALVHQMGGASAKEYEKINVTQTLELAKLAKQNGVKRFVFISTVKVYREETNEIYTEDSDCNPQDDYGKSKLKAENELYKFEGIDFSVSIIRTPIVYGYGVKANIKSLINLVQKVPVLPFGQINNKRSMVYIGNLSYLISEVIKQNKSGIFLAADDKPISTTRLIELIAKNINKKIYLIKIPFFESFLKLFKPSFQKRLYENLEINNNKTKIKLNLKNPYSVEEGVAIMIRGKW